VAIRATSLPAKQLYSQATLHTQYNSPGVILSINTQTQPTTKYEINSIGSFDFHIKINVVFCLDKSGFIAIMY